MKIISEPERLPDWWWVGLRVKCESCETVAELGKEDAQPRTHVHGAKFVSCPNCCHRAFLYRQES